MGTSAITALRELILEVVRSTARGEWKVFILDENTRRLIDSVVKEDDILRENVTNIEQIEDRRTTNAGLDAVYLLSPEANVVDCLVADIECRKYRKCFLVFSSLLPPDLRQKIDRAHNSQDLIAQLRILNIDFFPRESHLITFRNPWSFPILFHPACNHLVRRHMEELAQKIISVCVSLGEYPTIRYYRPQNPLHEAGVLCSHLALFVQDGLDDYASHHSDFPPPSPRPRGILMIVDRAIDLFAPLIHEFTYQAMVHELLPLKEGDRTLYRTILNQGSPHEETREMELGENDKIWVENRHLHMKDLLQKLVADFNKFRSENPQFAEESSSNPSTLNNIKDMLAGLPQFQEGKDLYSLHLGMTQECMNIFQSCKLPDIAAVEQSMATGVDEDDKKPRNLTDQVARLLDDDAITMPDRLRIIIEYILHRDGIFNTDIEKLLAHAQLPPRDGEIIQNMDLLGARVNRQLKDLKPPPLPLFSRKPMTQQRQEDLSISRFEPAIKSMLEEQLKGNLDQSIFPYTKPLLDANDAISNQVTMSQSSLRSAKPTWARTRPSANEPRQRVIVFMAGGATYSESRACYEVSSSYNKDVYLATSHMLTPSLFLQQVGDLSVDRRRLDLPADRPPRKAPSHLYEKEATQLQHQPQAQSGGLAAITTKSSGSNRDVTTIGNNESATMKMPRKSPDRSPPVSTSTHNPSKLTKEPKEKKRFFKF